MCWDGQWTIQSFGILESKGHRYSQVYKEYEELKGVSEMGWTRQDIQNIA